ncbi:protealysin inhibitor emfourin [Rhodococcoides yunnanense]|uniref:protealysin inhibitor emfourin n=1 Tax=Rhodococcoides yunnanense TaxID=278209 RepID=UPI0009324754|nr:protealysin inhibitor emfourin [Rhodococcus yunnanensis]
MFVEVVRSGGVAGITRRAHVDTDTVDDERTLLEWQHLIEAARPLLARLPEEQSPQQEKALSQDTSSPVPDGFMWSVSIGDTTCVADDASVTGPLRALALRTLREGRKH